MYLQLVYFVINSKFDCIFAKEFTNLNSIQIMEKREFLYEGKAKKIFKTDDPKVYLVEYKDDATAFNGQKKGTIDDKGVVNNRVSAKMFSLLEKKGIETHLVELIDDRRMYVKAVEIVMVEVIIRNIATGSLSKRLGIEDGKILDPTVLEFCYKSDELGDPVMNEYHILAMDLATQEEIDYIKQTSFKINELLKEEFAKLNLNLVDFKLEFGRFDGKIILADEISPDTCRLWELGTNEKMDKDRFRKDLGNVKAAYQEVLKRVETL